MKYVVVNEHTLGYLIEDMNNYVGILHTSILRGSSLNPYNSILLSKLDNVRKATKKDFDNFRVNLPPDFKQ